MLTRYAFSFHEVITRIEKLRHEARALKSSGTYPSIYAHTLSEFTVALTAMRTECDKLAGADVYGMALLDVTSTTDLLAHVESAVASRGDEYTYTDMLSHLDALSAVFATDLQKISLVRVPKEKDNFFQKDELFGPDVRAAFGSCFDEIRNAGTCYALEQDDACVFHLMRVLEHGLGALATNFTISFKRENWHNIIEQLEADIRKMDKSFGPDWKDKQKFYSRAATQFMFFKDAWRNHVMHGRLLFNDGGARSVLDSVRGFMQALAEGGLTE